METGMREERVRNGRGKGERPDTGTHTQKEEKRRKQIYFPLFLYNSLFRLLHPSSSGGFFGCNKKE